MAKSRVSVRRIYELDPDEQGIRVLVDRLWPRGVAKADAPIDEWCKEVAPSNDLRRWYGHDPAKFDEFSSRYRTELEEPGRAEALGHLKKLAGDGLVLVTATKKPEISQAAVLAELLR
jgi:uncharacterized protein YeaO (DUF488 family)